MCPKFVSQSRSNELKRVLFLTELKEFTPLCPCEWVLTFHVPELAQSMAEYPLSNSLNSDRCWRSPINTSFSDVRSSNFQATELIVKVEKLLFSGDRVSLCGFCFLLLSHIVHPSFSDFANNNV